VTAQIPDSVLVSGVGYQIIGVKGEGLLHPIDFGMQCRMMHTACYRGYIAQYEVRDGQLVLTRIHIQAEGEVLPIDGISPNQPFEHNRPVYEGLNVPAPFTGGLLLGRDFIQSMYVHMGFQKPIAYEEVVELHLEDGRVANIFDHSKNLAKKRRLAGEDAQKPWGKGRDDTMNWIETMFSLDYDL
jgi:hypothetical protein